MAGEVVRLRNTGDTDFSDRYAGARYNIPAGSEAIVPHEAMSLWFGNPTFVDLDKRRRFRTDEYHRLRVRYGCHDDLAKGITADEMWALRKPAIEAFNLEGERIITVADDPLGKHLTPHTETMAQNQLLQDQLESMARQQAQMQAELDRLQRQEAAETAGDAIPDATPTPERQITPPRPPAPAPESGATEDSPTRVRVSG